jgi:hypothetical protein
MKTQFNIFETLKVTLSTHTKATLLFFASWVLLIANIIFLMMQHFGSHQMTHSESNAVVVIAASGAIITCLIIHFIVFVQESPEYITTYLTLVDDERKDLERKIASNDAKADALKIKSAQLNAHVIYEENFSHLNTKE